MENKKDKVRQQTAKEIEDLIALLLRKVKGFSIEEVNYRKALYDIDKEIKQKYLDDKNGKK